MYTNEKPIECAHNLTSLAKTIKELNEIGYVPFGVIGCNRQNHLKIIKELIRCHNTLKSYDKPISNKGVSQAHLKDIYNKFPPLKMVRMINNNEVRIVVFMKTNENKVLFKGHYIVSYAVLELLHMTTLLYEGNIHYDFPMALETDNYKAILKFSCDRHKPNPKEIKVIPIDLNDIDMSGIARFIFNGVPENDRPMTEYWNGDKKIKLRKIIQLTKLEEFDYLDRCWIERLDALIRYQFPEIQTIVYKPLTEFPIFSFGEKGEEMFKCYATTGYIAVYSPDHLIEKTKGLLTYFNYYYQLLKNRKVKIAEQEKIDPILLDKSLYVTQPDIVTKQTDIGLYGMKREEIAEIGKRGFANAKDCVAKCLESERDLIDRKRHFNYSNTI